MRQCMGRGKNNAWHLSSSLCKTDTLLSPLLSTEGWRVGVLALTQGCRLWSFWPAQNVLSVMCMTIHPGDWELHSWDRRRSCIHLYCCLTTRTWYQWCPVPSIYIAHVAMGWLGFSPSSLSSVGCLCTKCLIFSSLNQQASLGVLFSWWWEQCKRWAETQKCLKFKAQSWCNVPSTSFHWPKPGSWPNTRSTGREICPNLLVGGSINSFGKELNTERGQGLGQKLYPWRVMFL